MLMTSMRGNARRVSYGARTMVYLLAGILFLFAFAACDPMMDDMDGKDDNGNGTPITGGSGNDTLTGTAKSEAFEASAGSDTITSFSLATGNSDTIDFGGFTGDNAVDIGELSFALSTGEDTDNLVITGYGDGNTLTLSNAFADGGAFYANGAALSLNAAISLLTAATTGPLTSLEAASGQGTATGDTLTAGEAGAHLFGFEGDDVLTAHAGGSVLFAGNGNDTLSSAAGADELYGGAGSDTALYASESTFTVTAASTGGYTVTGGTLYGSDTLIDIETIQLSDTDDTIENLSAAVSGIAINGGEGTDAITLSNTGVTADLSNYTNFETITGGTGNDTITGSAGNETISGGAGTNTLNGAGGNDTFIAGTGTDTFNGGDGSDTVDYSADTDGVTVDLSDTSDALSFIENIIGGSGADTFTGTAEANSFTGGGGIDTFNVSQGIDTIDFDFESGAIPPVLDVLNFSALPTITTRAFSPAVGPEGKLQVNFDSTGNGTADSGFIFTAQDVANAAAAETALYNMRERFNVPIEFVVTPSTTQTSYAGSATRTDDHIDFSQLGNGVSVRVNLSNADFASFRPSISDTISTFSALKNTAEVIPTDGANMPTGTATSYTLSDIEHITGSNSYDILIGNSAANILDGGGGDSVKFFL